MARRVFITVGEVSGDQHAAKLIRCLRELDSEIEVEGIGGPAMAAAGARLLYDSVSGAAMGWRGALRAVEVARLLKRLRSHYRQQKPDLHVCIDSSSMNLPFARLVKRFDVPVLYYIAPQLWASREWRMKKMRAWVDRVACILPFEEQYFRRHEVDATFVGHPLFDELPQVRDRRQRPLFPQRPPVIGIIPGSRRSEVTANFPHQLEVAQHIRQAHPGVQFLIPTTPSGHPLVMELAGSAADMQIRCNAFDEYIPQCDLVLCKSGTSTLHVAAYCVPMIVVYRINPVLWHMAGRWLVKTPHIALVNILAGNIDLVPEYIPWYGSNEPVWRCALELLADRVKLDAQREKLRQLVAPLDHRGASMNTARLAMEMMTT